MLSSLLKIDGKMLEGFYYSIKDDDKSVDKGSIIYVNAVYRTIKTNEQEIWFFTVSCSPTVTIKEQRRVL